MLNDHKSKFFSKILFLSFLFLGTLQGAQLKAQDLKLKNRGGKLVRPVREPILKSISKNKFLSGVIQSLTCEGGEGVFFFSVSSKPQNQIIPFTYTISYNGNAIYSGTGATNTSIQITEQLINQPLEAGLYSISGVISSSPNPSPFNGEVYLGYELYWDEINAGYAQQPNSYSAVAQLSNPIGYLQGVSANCGGAQMNDWIQFTPIATSSATNADNIIRFTKNNFNTQSPPVTESYLRFKKNGAGVKMIWNDVQNQTSAFVNLNANPKIRVEFKSGGIEVYANDNLETTLPNNSGPVIVRCQSNSQGDGFINITTSYSCKPPVYAKLERKIKGVKYKTQFDKIFFSYDEEYYRSTTSTLNYKIYASTDRVVPLLTGNNTQTSVVYGDNRYGIDVSTLNNGAYILEVENDKNEAFFLRFIKD